MLANVQSALAVRNTQQVRANVAGADELCFVQSILRYARGGVKGVGAAARVVNARRQCRRRVRKRLLQGCASVRV